MPGGPAGGGTTTFFTADFESDTAGKQPAGWDNFISYNFKPTNPSKVTERARSSTAPACTAAARTRCTSEELRITRARSNAPCRPGRPTSISCVYFYLDQCSWGTAGAASENHETLLGLTSDPTSAQTTRFASAMIKGAIGTNQVPTDNIAPSRPTGTWRPVISANAWHCIEVEFDGSAG